jgi:DNA-binding transcriptional LysR family regulator
MDYRYLKAFYLTAHLSSFSKAANELRIAQSAVSRQIKLLEESIGEELIIRSSKKVVLTDKGQALFQSISQFEHQTSQIFETEKSRPIRIGILEGLLLNWFQPILMKFQKKFEYGANIEVRDVNYLKSGLESGYFDVIFTTENIQNELMSSRRLFKEKLVIASKAEVNRKKLHEYSWIVYSENDYLYKASRKVPPKILQVSHLNSIINMVKQNLGIAIVPAHVIKKGESLITQEISIGSESNYIYLATLNFKNFPKPIATLLDIIDQANS